MRHFFVSPLTDDLWHDTEAGRRSRELTPLYIERFAGPRVSLLATAHDYWELIAVGAGEGVMQTTTPFPLLPGTVCLLPPGVPHIEEAPKPMELFWIGVRGSRVESLRPRTPHVVTAGGLLELCRALWTLRQTALHGIGPELDGLTLVLFNRLLRMRSLDTQPAASRIETALASLHTNLADEIAIPDLAARCGYSEGHFYREFKRLTGQTPVQYLTTLRLQEAKRWLANSNQAVSAIATLVGFTSPQYFSRVFHAALGMSPAAFRRKSRE
jgi:AraC-like DNA-binding protein